MSDQIQKQNNPDITKKDLRRAGVRYNFMAVNLFNYESQMGPAVAWALAPILRKIYKNDDDYQAALDNHFNYFNSTTVMSSMILGATTAMEAKDGIKSKDAVQSLKTSLMGPLAGVGDTLVWVLWPTIIGSISGYMALQGNPLGAIVWLIANIVFWFVKVKMFEVGYTSGTKLVTTLGSKMTLFTEAASIMGLSVVGALVATVVKVQTPLKFQFGKVGLALQSGVLDKIMPALLPALLTLLVYKLLDNKKWTPTRIILLVIVIALAGSFFGVFKA
ncbi:PTS family mannose fructose sorbose porter component IID [Agrilactobacillus composti DSM 18527 = JCM 14202]|uniref:PTS family mannose fructose sorbose porter component IID n=1 Tax=Agrilactobacillus composti DSM 18527 = JCM 14202 TaxID=1423734 RepID=A0A0R1Y3D3_9LACO|nr:PTS family mannose fructose sorbose porter component IID [Agrilactobacillus composti DSM 18527 = JCM 14202]